MNKAEQLHEHMHHYVVVIGKDRGSTLRIDHVKSWETPLQSSASFLVISLSLCIAPQTSFDIIAGNVMTV